MNSNSSRAASSGEFELNTFAIIAAMQKDMVEEVTEIKEMISLDKELPHDRINSGIRKIKDKILAKEGGIQANNRESLKKSPNLGIYLWFSVQNVRIIPNKEMALSFNKRRTDGDK